MTSADRLLAFVATVVIGATTSFACTNHESSPGTTTVALPGASSAPSLPSSAAPLPSTAPLATAAPVRVEGHGESPVTVGEPIDLADLGGRIVFDDYEDVYTMRPDGTDVRNLTGQTGPEFDGAWAPDGQFVVYRDSRRGINDDDEIYIVRADGTEARNLTNDPANDWGPDWSSDGKWIMFNSDRKGGALDGYLVRPDGTDLTRLPTDVWVEYPTFSPDGTKIAFMSHVSDDYDIFVADVATGEATQLTDASGSDGWPAWSPDSTTIAFSANATIAPERPMTRTAGTPASLASTMTSGSWAPTARTSVA